MEHAPLRPVPSRAVGPVDPLSAIRGVEAAFPSLSPLEARALALVALAERPRAEVAEELRVSEERLSGLLASARKELRRSVATLPGSGWCERAEQLISDRFDGALTGHGTALLDAHLRNCPRCVEHERRLVQAADALLLRATPPPPAPAPVEEAPPPAEPPVEEPPPAEEPPVEEPPVEAPPIQEPPVEEPPVRALVPERAPASPTRDEVAAAAEVLVTARTRRQLAAAITWNALAVLAILLALATLAAVIAGVLGAGL